MTRKTARLGAFLLCVGFLLLTLWAVACDPEEHPTRWEVSPVLAAIALAAGLRWWELRPRPPARDSLVRCRCCPDRDEPWGTYRRVGDVWAEECPLHGLTGVERPYR